MPIEKETEQKIAQLQLLEQNLQTLLLQKQNFQAQHAEIENAFEEIKKTKGPAYKIIGSVMVLSDKESLKKNLQDKKEVIELRIKNLEKQESRIKEQASKLQADVVDKIKPSVKKESKK